MRANPKGSFYTNVLIIVTYLVGNDNGIPISNDIKKRKSERITKGHIIFYYVI